MSPLSDYDYGRVSLSSSDTMYIPVREDPGLVGLCDDDDDSCLKNSRGFMERWDTNAAASYRSSSIHKQEIK